MHANAVDITDGDSMFLYAVQGIDLDSISSEGQGEFYVQCLYNSLNAVAQDVNVFDTSKRCAVCGKTGHTFANCEFLQGDLKDAHIKILVLINKFRNAIERINNSRALQGRKPDHNLNLLSSVSVKEIDSLTDFPRDDSAELHQLREELDQLRPAVNSLIDVIHQLDTSSVSSLQQSSSPRETDDDDDSASSLPLTSPDFRKAVNQLLQYRS